MRELNDLLTTPDGVAFLASNDIWIHPEDFLARLEPPVQSGLIPASDAGPHKPVYALQQIYVDCTQSMLDRMVLLDRLEPLADCYPFFLWIDTDLSGTDALMHRFHWPLFNKTVSVRLSPGAHDSRELRFIPIEPPRLEQALDKLNTYLGQSISGRKKVTRSRVRAKFEQLKAVFLQQPDEMLSDLNYRVIHFLLNQQSGLNPAPMIVSELLDRDVITGEINVYLNHLDEAISTFNDAVEALRAEDIDPKVKPLAADYLPLHFSCLDCHRRLRLHREQQGQDQFATANCKCKQSYRFYLGRHELTMDEIAQAGPWSPDVSLTLFLNDFVSGYIGGGSSGIYYGL
ncbi:hypothetical protein, partial [Candidatus Entotheonella palauensis]|uniref:hypothetical protein n=1 Tax=Candidatus Entotheonella palauensis TaxID=93172 RepID=UPI001177B7D7